MRVRLLTFVWFDNIADAERVDVAVIAAGELSSVQSAFVIQNRFRLGTEAVDHVTYCSGNPLATKLAQGIRVLWVVIVVFFQGEGVVIRISLRKADTVRCLTAGNENLLDTQFACYSNKVKTVLSNREHHRHIPASTTL